MDKIVKLLNKTIILATAIIATTAMAQEDITVKNNSTNTAVLNNIFDTAQPENIQVLELSNQEMKDTQGAVANFIIGAGIGAGGYAFSNGINAYSAAGCFTCAGFVNSYQENWSWSNAAFSTGVGALTGGVGGAALRSTGITQNWGQMTFANRGFVANTAKNLQRTWTNPIGIGIKVTGMGVGTAANQTYTRFK